MNSFTIIMSPQTNVTVNVLYVMHRLGSSKARLHAHFVVYSCANLVHVQQHQSLLMILVIISIIHVVMSVKINARGFRNPNHGFFD